MKSITLIEGKTQLKVPNPKEYKLDSHMPVFFNPIMHLNRDISIILLHAINNKLNKTLDKRTDKILDKRTDKTLDNRISRKISVLDLLSASGARGIRIAREVSDVNVTLNDANPSAIELMSKNASLNKANVKIVRSSANRFLRESRRTWDYIDIDPFGTPMPFLENAIKRLSKSGILAITATDTSALCGTYPKACLRKYESKSLRCPSMHELGLRILICAIQKIARKQKRNLKPIFSHSSNHYMRVYLQDTTKSQTDDGFFVYNFNTGEMKTRKTHLTKSLPSAEKQIACAGPMWLGELWDKNLVKTMLNEALKTKFKMGANAIKLLEQIMKESRVKTVGFYDLHVLGKIHHLSGLPKIANVIENLRKNGFKAERTHITPTGIKTDAKLKNVLIAISNG